MNSKIAFRNTFKLMNNERPIFVPFVYGLAARLEHISLQEMNSDASYYTHSLVNAHELVGYDGIVTAFDDTLEAEALGCELEWYGDYATPKVVSCRQLALGEVKPEESSRIQILLETTKRTVITKGRDVAIIGVLTGPYSLVKSLTSDNSERVEDVISQARSFLIKMVKSLGDLRVDAIFFREDSIPTSSNHHLLLDNGRYTDIYKTLLNLVKYYDCFTALIVKNAEHDFINELIKMIEPDGLVLLGKRVSDDDMIYLQELSDSLKVSFGLPLPLENQDELRTQFDIISRYVNNHRPNGFFYVSEGEIPYDIPLENLHDLMARIRSA